MPTTYEKCDDSVGVIVRGVMEQYHLDLTEAGVTIALLFARNSEDAPVKLHGYPCAAVVRKTGLKDRAKGNADAEIVIDEMHWNSLNDAERRALIDHELYHLEVVLDENNAIELDDLGRPKLRLKLHDTQIGIFRTIITRHGRHALDAQIASQFIADYTPMVAKAYGVGSGDDDATDDKGDE